MFRKLAVFAGLTFALVGCSDGSPSADEMRAAMENQFQSLVFDSFEKLSCAKINDIRYECTYNNSGRLGSLPQRAVGSTGCYTKIGDRWKWAANAC